MASEKWCLHLNLHSLLSYSMVTVGLLSMCKLPSFQVFVFTPGIQSREYRIYVATMEKYQHYILFIWTPGSYHLRLPASGFYPLYLHFAKMNHVVMVASKTIKIWSRYWVYCIVPVESWSTPYFNHLAIMSPVMKVTSKTTKYWSRYVR